MIFELLEKLICPISRDYIMEPVTIQDGITYEKECITTWIQKEKKSPCSKEKITKVSNKNLFLADFLDVVSEEIQKEENIFNDNINKFIIPYVFNYGKMDKLFEKYKERPDVIDKIIEIFIREEATKKTEKNKKNIINYMISYAPLDIIEKYKNSFDKETLSQTRKNYFDKEICKNDETIMAIMEKLNILSIEYCSNMNYFCHNIVLVKYLSKLSNNEHFMSSLIHSMQLNGKMTSDTCVEILQFAHDEKLLIEPDDYALMHIANNDVMNDWKKYSPYVHTLNSKELYEFLIALMKLPSHYTLKKSLISKIAKYYVDFIHDEHFLQCLFVFACHYEIMSVVRKLMARIKYKIIAKHEKYIGFFLSAETNEYDYVKKYIIQNNIDNSYILNLIIHNSTAIFKPAENMGYDEGDDEEFTVSVVNNLNEFVDLSKDFDDNTISTRNTDEISYEQEDLDRNNDYLTSESEDDEDDDDSIIIQNNVNAVEETNPAPQVVQRQRYVVQDNPESVVQENPEPVVQRQRYVVRQVVHSSDDDEDSEEHSSDDDSSGEDEIIDRINFFTDLQNTVRRIMESSSIDPGESSSSEDEV